MKIRVLLLHESHNWAPDIVQRAGEIYGIYLYNPNLHVYCCEFTPSFELTFVGSVSEKSDEQIRDEIQEGDSQCEPIHYMHSHYVEGLPKIKRGTVTSGTYPLRHSYGYSWDSMEEAEEFWRVRPGY
jgi:hypothetical protein